MVAASPTEDRGVLVNDKVWHLNGDEFTINKMPTYCLEVLKLMVLFGLKFPAYHKDKWKVLLDIEAELRRRVWWRRLFKKRWWYT